VINMIKRAHASSTAVSIYTCYAVSRVHSSVMCTSLPICLSLPSVPYPSLSRLSCAHPSPFLRPGHLSICPISSCRHLSLSSDPRHPFSQASLSGCIRDMHLICTPSSHSPSCPSWPQKSLSPCPRLSFSMRPICHIYRLVRHSQASVSSHLSLGHPTRVYMVHRLFVSAIRFIQSYLSSRRPF
jgi:hypothetical protein